MFREQGLPLFLQCPLPLLLRYLNNLVALSRLAFVARVVVLWLAVVVGARPRLLRYWKSQMAPARLVVVLWLAFVAGGVWSVPLSSTQSMIV
jgi:hypothetical protein